MSVAEYNLAKLIPEFHLVFEGDFTSPEGLSATFVLVLLALAALFAVWSLWSYFLATKTLKFYRRLIKSLSAEQLLLKRRDISNEALKNRQYGQLWREFDESLVHIQYRDRLCNTLDAAHFFNTHTLSPGLTENRLLAAVPGFLTAIGVIGTFAGLQMGLAQLGNLGAQDADTLKNGISGLIGGASIAFMTSVWGVFTSVLFNFFEKFLERNIRGSISNFQNQVDYLYPRITAEQTLTNIEDFSRQSTEKLGELDEKIGHKMQEAMRQASETIRDGMEHSLNTILGPAIEKLVENAHSGSEKALEGLLDRFLDGVGKAGDSQRQMMEQAAVEINAAAGGMTAGLSDFANKLDSHIEGMVEKNAQVMGEVEAMMRAQLDEQQGRAQVMQNQFSDHLTQMQGSQSQLTDSIENVLVTQQAQHESITASLEQLLEGFQQLSGSHQASSQAMQLAAGDMKATSNQLGILSSNLKAATDNLSENLQQAIEQVKGTAQQNSDSINLLQQLTVQIDVVNSRMGEASATMATAAERADSGLSAVDRHFNQLSASLKEHVENLNQQVQKLLDEYAGRVQAQTSNRLNAWNEQTNAYISAMTNAVTTINDVVDEIDSKITTARAVSRA